MDSKIVMVVEDEPNNMRIITDILEFEGHQVIAAESVAEAHDVMAKHARLDLVLLDLNLPDGNGLSLVEAFRARFAHLQIMLVTAAATKDNIQKAMAHGIDQILGKPFTVKQFKEALQTVFKAE